VGNVESLRYRGNKPEVTDTFDAGETVVLRAYVVDDGGQPVEGATVTMEITGPESLQVTTGSSTSDGIAEATWNTRKPKPHGGGGTSPGSYEARVSGVILDGSSWGGTATSTTFAVQ
jgi:hypothetical protein